MADAVGDKVRVYFYLGLNYKEIIKTLAHVDGIILSLRTLNRILSKSGLCRRKNKADILDVALFIMKDLEAAGKLHGYKFMHLKCIQNGLVMKSTPIPHEDDRMLYFGVKELWTDLEGRESYPVKELKDFLGRLSDDSGDGITFDFSGIEQVTDLALYALSSSLETKAASKVKKIVLTGCQYVTDYGVSQLSLAFSNLEEVILDGCAAVTEKSVFHLKRRCPHLTHLSVISTSIGDIPLPIGDTKIYLDGCPIFTGIDLQEASPLVEQKVVILVQPTLTLSVLDLLKDGVFKETTGDRCLHYCPKVTVGGATANVFEFHTDSTYDYLPFLSSGATYIITVELTTAEECAKGLLEAYRNIKTRTCHSCFVVLILHKEDVRGAKSVQKTMLNSLHAAENAFKKHVSEPMHSNGDFYRQLLQARNQEILSAEQQELTKLSFFGFDKKTSCISKLGSNSNVVGDDSGTSKSGAVESKDGLQNELQACFEHLSETCPWESKQVSAEVKQFYDQLPQEKILTMAGLISKSGGKTDDGGPFRKLLSRLDRMGRLVYCPNVYHETVILDVQWLMDVLMIPHNMEEYQNGDHTTALPANVPLFEEAKFKTLYVSCCTDVEYSAMKNLLKVLRLIFNVPCWPLGGGQKENLIAFAADLPPSPSIRHAAPDLNIWEEFWPDKKLPTDAEVNYRYQVHTGVPSSAISWISSKLLPRHDVLFLWKHGIIFRDGAVEVLLIEEDVPVPSINLQARCTRFESGKGKIDLILAEYLWNVMNDICLLVESVLHSFIHCSYAVVVPCPGECPNNGAFHIINPDHLKPDPNHVVTCQKCGGEIDKSVVSFVNGRRRCLPLHDWRNEKTGYRCSTCRVNEGRAMKRWIMECQLHPNFASRCFKMFCDGDKVGSSMSGNILASRGSRPCYVISEHPLSEADFSQLDLCIIDPAGIEFLLVQEPIKYLTKDAEDRVKMTHCAISLETGQVLGVEEMVEKRPFKKGDQMRVSVSRQKQDTDDTSMFVCDVFKNGIPMHQFTLPEKSHVVIRCGGKDEAEKTKLILSSPRCPVVTSAHFQVGTCLLHKVDGSTTWYGGIIEKINDGYLYVVRTTADGLAAQSTRFLPDSEELAPLCHFPADADVVLSQGQVTSEDMIFSFLKQYFVTPAPMGLFPAFTNMPNYKPLQLHSIRAKSCVTSVYSPSMLYQSFKISGKPAVLKRQPLGFVVLPVNIKEHHLYHTGRQLTQDWANQGIGFMCKGEMLAHSTMRIGHLQDGKVAPLVSDQLQLFSLDEKSKLWKFLINSVYFLLQSYAQLTTQPPIVSSWTHLLPDISQDLSHDHISEALSKITRWYQHTLVLFCALSSPLKNFYPPYFNGMEFADIIRKVTMVMKDELNPNNVFGFCDTHHYLLRAFRVNKDPEDPGALPKLAVDLTKLGLNSSCIRELKIEEFPTDSIPSVVLQCMQKFPNLIRVQLSKCGLTSVRGIETCESLKTFEADSNELEHLHHGFEKLKHTLQVLNLSDNPLKQLPVSLSSFSKLNQLSICNTLITELPDDIGELTSLQNLDISKNRMAQLPESFRNLKNLESLTFSGIPYLFYAFKKGVMVSQRHFLNWCTQKLNGAHSMSTFTYEEKIEMFNSCQKDSSDVLTHRGVNQLNNHLFWKVPRLGTADKSAADPYGCVPPQIFSCRRLTSLVLSFQGIRFLPDDFNKLRHLRKIILDHCRMLHTVSAEVGKLPLQVLAMGQCRKLQTPPPEVLKQGMAYTLYYMKKLAAGSQACYRTKLMFVGLGGAGKTSLMRSLMSGDLKSPPIGSEGITDGIDIKSWVINRENQALTYSVWDFAGQTVYYNTHQFFLTSRAIYFLTWNSRLGFEHAGLEFWLSSIQCHAPYAPVFVVGTHADQVSKSDLPRDDLKRNYPSIAGFYSISSLTGVGIRQLLDDLFHVTLKQPYIGERVPEVWIKMERAIARDRDNKCNLLSWEEIRDLAGKYDLDESETKQAVKFLHDLGSLQHFDNQSLKNKVVINPQWIVDVMACVVSVHNSCIKEGRLRYEDISKIWSDYPADLHDWLLSLTEAFDLTFPLPDQKVNVVPCLLPQGQPEFAWPEMQPGDGTRQAKILYRFDILPAGLFNRVQVRLYQISDSSSMWKRGSLLRKNDHIGLMIMRGGSEVLVKAQGVRPENIIFLVHEVFESVIFEFFKGVSYEYLIPCLDCMKNACENATMFSSTILRRAIMLKAPFIQCHSSFHSLPMSDVQGCMPPEMSDDFNLQFHMTMKDLDRMHDSFLYDCGFIYCQADVPQEGSEAIHPKRLVKDLQTMENGYKCWHNEDLQSLPLNDVLKNIGDCKCIILFISSNFTRDDFCGKIFRFVYDILKKPVLLVTLGQGHQWRESDIGIKITHKVYINMQKSWLYNAKLVALEKQIRSIVRSDRVQHRCDVFISYSWLNSIAAIQAGHVTRKENAMGFGDPREIKEFLEKNGVTCWIDIEKTGVDGLFEEIAQGLKQCKVMVACISNEYALSSNCQMEFRFAAVTLKMPIVLAVVGTGYAWESTEIGLLSLGHDKSNFQINNSECYDQLLRDVREKLSLVDQPEEIVSNPGQPHGFRELYELAQRKFMRQFSSYAENGHEYPRLFVVDTVVPPKADDKTSVKDAEALELEIADVSQEGEAVIKDATDFCFRILCEYEEGWHVCHDGFPINMVGSELSQLWKTSAPYFGRMLKLLKHSNIDLNCFGTLDGDLLIDTLETNVGVNVDLKPIYQEIREHIIRKDYEMTYGGLKLCYLPNGKYLWLCDQHQNLPRVTVLQNEASPSSASETELTEDVLLEKLNKFNEKETTNKFPKVRHHKQGKRQKKQKGGKFDQKVERGDKLGEGGREVEKGRGGNEGDVTSANGSDAVVEPSVSNKGDVTSANGSEAVVEPSVSNKGDVTSANGSEAVVEPSVSNKGDVTSANGSEAVVEPSVSNKGDVTSANGSEAVVEPSVSNKGDVTSANGSEAVVEPSVSNGHKETYQQREESVGPAGAESDGKGGKPSVRDDDTSVAHSFKETSRKPGQSGLVDREMLSVVKEKVPGAARVRPKTAPAPSQARPRIQRANSIAESAPYTSKACVIL